MSDIEHGIGAGVVIVDKGLILTNLHVVAGADKVKVTLSTASNGTALASYMQPENVAVLKAQQVPDDMAPATLARPRTSSPATKWSRSTPFGIGPSVSSGVVSGLK